MTSPQHGSTSRYSYGCRCQPCKDAQAAYQRELRARKEGDDYQPRKRGRKAATLAHGTTSGYSKGCRCPECKQAQSEHGRRKRQQDRERSARLEAEQRIAQEVAKRLRARLREIWRQEQAGYDA